MDSDTVLEEWNKLTNMLSDVDKTSKTGPKAILNVIRKLKPVAGDKFLLAAPQVLALEFFNLKISFCTDK